MDAHDSHALRLVTFAPAIDSEVSRWVLDHHGVTYHERASAPALVVLRALAHGASSVPFLLAPGEAVGGARSIAERYGDLWAPTTKEALEAAWNEYNQTLGFAVARFVYSFVLPDERLGKPLLSAGVPEGERSWTDWSYPIIRRVMWWALGGSPQAVAAAKEDIERVTARTEALLADGRPYLTGSTFTLADVLFCASTAPLMLWPEYGGPLPALEAVPEELRSAAMHHRRRPAGDYVARVYRNHRKRRS